jgi:hypothetical protein
MRYLVKTEADKTFHFRVNVEGQYCDIVEGQFYNWLNRYSQSSGDHETAESNADALIKQKVDEGFKEVPFVKRLENDLDVYDKAEWHYGGDFPEELATFQGFIHTGMFLGWLIDNSLVSDDFKRNNEQEILQFKKQKLKGSQIFERCCDGVLAIDDLNETGNRFALSYFNLETGQYLSDYAESLGEHLPGLYHVADTWENYNKLKRIVDMRFSEWKNKNC